MSGNSAGEQTPQPTPAPVTQSKPAEKRRNKSDSKPKRNSNGSSPDLPVQSPPAVLPAPIYHQPFAPAFIMNPPPYPISGSHMSQQQHPGYPQHPPIQVPPGTPIPPPAHYSYPMPPGPYAGYSYQYPPMMMYGSPHVPHQDHHSTPPEQASGSKRKRKAGKGKGDVSDDDGASGSDARTQAAQVDLKKRTKTQRACDSCRSRKIRCDILPDAKDPPMCQHCKQYGFECTFFLPITETRFKKKIRQEDDPVDKEKPDTSKSVAHLHDPQPKREIGVFGPTSAAHLLHSQATIPSRVYENYDLRHNHTFEVSQSGDGLIQILKPVYPEQLPSLPKPLDVRVEPETVQQLINAYFSEVAPLLPVVTQAEFLANNNPPPILLYSMCLVAAARREVPQGIFDSIRYTVNNIIKADDVLSTATTANVQALLILCMSGDCHSQFVPSALSALWVRSGAAIRMAQDLGLHRAESVSQNIELRRRLWAACVISDRWTSLTYGHPFMIDVQDCDARLPSSGDPNDLYMDELVRLSVVLGRVLKTIYSPSGLTLVTDDMLSQLLSDIQAWQDNLPDSLRFTGPETPRNAGLLHLLYTCVCILFWRVFMRISYSCPSHLKFGLTVEQWTKLVALTGDAIDWLDAHERIYDVWLLVAYAATACALVQYHTWARREDVEACAKLRKLRDCVRRWEGSLSPDHMSARRKTAEIIALLYEATQGPRYPINSPPALNPTGGVKGKQPLDGLDYRKDPSRPGGGVFVAHGKARESDFKDLPAGTVISSNSDEENEDRTTSQEESQPPTTSPSLVNFTPLGGGSRSGSNMNPAMNAQSGPSSQVINILDTPQSSNTLQQHAMTDSGFLEGIPGGMFDWGQWDTFFSRLNAGSAEMAAALQQREREQQQT